MNTYTHSQAIADTGCTGHYINSNTPHQPITIPHHLLPTVTFPDNSKIKASHAGELPLPSTLSRQAKLAYSFPSIAQPLVSIGKLCDDDCTAIFTKQNCYIIKNDQIDTSMFPKNSILQGIRNDHNKLWYFNINKCTEPNGNANTTIYEMKKQS